jgi:hypothetical protein
MRRDKETIETEKKDQANRDENQVQQSAIKHEGFSFNRKESLSLMILSLDFECYYSFNFNLI